MRILKKMTLAAVLTMIGVNAHADSITKPTTFAVGGTIKSAEVNANFDTVYGQVNKIGSVINTDQVNNRLIVGGNLWNKEGILTIESNPNGTFNSGYGGHHIVLVNPAATSTISEGNLNKAAITKYNDGSLNIYSYTGGGAGEDKPIVFRRNGTASSEVMRIHSNGNVGIGTSTPEAPFHVSSTTTQGPDQVGFRAYAAIGMLQIGTISADSLHSTVLIPQSGDQDLILSTWSHNPMERIRIRQNGNIGMGVSTPSYPLHMASGAYVTTGGTWTNASSRELKDNITDLSLVAAKTVLEQLNPVTFTYKKEPDSQHVGFIAEDVPDMVATKDRKGLSPMDIVAVVTKVVQDQQKTITAQQEEIQTLKTMLQRTLASISSIQHKVSQLEAAQPVPFLQKASYTETVH